jgi:stage IV sporulation protein FB
MIKSEYRVGQVWGIPIKIHISLLVLLAYMALRVLGASHSSLEALIGMFSVLIIGTLLFSSVALHELGHSFVAIHKGCRVHEITLMFMGGAAKMNKMPSRPFDEFMMAIAGPAVSLIIGVIGISAGKLLNNTVGISGFIASIFTFVGRINLILAFFNLIPAFPMDGGRVFRAILASRYGRIRATYIASRLGRVIAAGFFIVGIFGIKQFEVMGMHPFPPHNPVLIIIAIFIYITADREYRMVQFEELTKQRNSAFSGWSFGAPPPPPTTDTEDDSVYISPPPYIHGPDARTKLKHTDKDNDNPIKRFFGR